MPLVTLSSLWRLLLAILAVQAVWWWLINPLFHSSSLPPVTVIDSAEVVPLASPERTPLETLDWQTVSLTWSDCCQHHFFAVRMSLPVAEGSDRDLGLIAQVGADNFWVFVNEVSVRSEGTLKPSTYHGLWKGVIRVPRELVKDKDNEVLILTARNGDYYTDVFRSYVGDYAAMIEATRWRQFVMGELRLINTLIPLLIGLVALLLVVRAHNRVFLIALALLALVWGARNGFYQWESFSYGDFARRSYYAWVTNALPVAWFFFVHAWVGDGNRRWTQVVTATVGIWLATGFLITYRLLDGSLAGIEFGETIIEYFGVLVIALAIVRVVAHLVWVSEARTWEAVLLILCMSTFAMEMAEYFLGPFGLKSASHSAAIFLFSFVVMIIARNVQLYESMEAFNQELNERLSESEAEIRQGYASLQRANKEATLAAERQRLLQDMHDGIGAQLVGLLAVVRGERRSFDTVEQGLSEILDDLRLIIDSLDSGTDDLTVALGTFRNRVEPRLTTASIQSAWDFDDLPLGVPCSPAQTLQLYRILQEGLSNALQHSGATLVRFSAKLTGDQASSVKVCIEDNGQWRAPSAERQHRGLASMQNRAAALGGELSVDGTANGTSIMLLFEPKVAYDDAENPHI